MAGQAQDTSNAMVTSLHGRTPKDALEELESLHYGNSRSRGLLGVYTHLFDPLAMINAGTVMSGPQQSGLTSDASGSRRKRSRDEPMMALPQLCTNHLQVSRLLESEGTSTSGRPAFVSIPSTVVSPLGQGLMSQLWPQDMEMEALIRLHSERLRLGMEEATKRLCGALLCMLEQRVAKRLQEKEAQLEVAVQRNAELEEKMRLVSEQSLFWFEAAKNSEAIVSSLRAAVEQCGGSEGVLCPADDAQSCCYQGDEQRGGKEKSACRNACRACRSKEVCVLLLPCRHVCLCKDCEPKLGMCPICQSVKNASLLVFMS